MNPSVFRLVCVVCACAMTTAAQAQTSRAVDVGVAYSFLREEDGLNMPVGWLLSVAGRATNVISIVGEVAGNYGTAGAEDVQIHTFQAGVRFLARQNPHVTPWGQFLLGGTTESCCSDSETRFSIEPGGGVDVRLSGRVAIRLGVGFSLLYVDGRHAWDMFRFHVGLVF